jgi:hypothetical protein
MWNVMTQDIPIIMQAQTAHTNYKVWETYNQRQPAYK